MNLLGPRRHCISQKNRENIKMKKVICNNLIVIIRRYCVKFKLEE